MVRENTLENLNSLKNYIKIRHKASSVKELQAMIHTETLRFSLDEFKIFLSLRTKVLKEF
jgi:hypothetical protein